MTIDSPLVRGSASPVRPSAAQSAQTPTSLPVFQAGFSLYVYGNPEDFIERSEEILDHLVTLNVNALSLTFFLYQDSWTASVIYDDDNQTLNSENLKAFAAAAHEREIAVTLRPLLEEESLIPDGRWRGSIEPSDIEGWFTSYSSILMKYAALAEESGVEALSVGAELQSLEPYASYWASLIDSVRESYSGAITYSFNWNSPSQTLLELTSLLDFIGIDAFYPLGAPSGASTETLIAAWQPWLEQVHTLHVTSGKPIVFSEIGTRSQPGSYQAPWQWVSEGAVSQEDQAVYFESLCSSLAASRVNEPGVRLRAEPSIDSQIVEELSEGARVELLGESAEGDGYRWESVRSLATGMTGYLADTFLTSGLVVDGLYIWAVDFYEGIDLPEDDPGFSPLNKQAESVIADCFADLLEDSALGVLGAPPRE